MFHVSKVLDFQIYGNETTRYENNLVGFFQARTGVTQSLHFEVRNNQIETEDDFIQLGFTKEWNFYDITVPNIINFLPYFLGFTKETM